MSLQTTVLVNGTWATRTVDIGELLFRNRESDSISGRAEKAQTPATGILSRTLAQGPAVQWILPARLRHQDQNDVVFIGDKFIQIKELVPSGHLEEVVTKSDFDSRIIGAKIINSQPGPELEDQIKQGGRVSSHHTQGSQDEGKVPPHILVLVLSSKEILFMFTKPGSRGVPEFVYSRRPLPADTSALEEYGRHIAVEPRARAMAICAAQKFFGVFSLKSPSMIQAEMAQGPVNPIKEECFFRADGDILRMEFLYPTPPDNDRIILLLLIAQDSESYYVTYDWTSMETLRSVDPRVNSLRLSNHYRLPTVLIPLIHSTSFMVATHSTMSIYKNVLNTDGPVAPMNCPFPTLEHRPRSRNQVWTHWARARRNRTRNAQFDDIYLCREDGMILYLEIGKSGDIERQSNLGSLGCNLDTAFAILPEGYQAGDVLVTAGSMCGGGLFIEDARKPPRCIQRVPNWGPILDTAVIKARRPTTSPLSRDTQQGMGLPFDRIFTCSGVGPDHGTISELRYGIEAQIGLNIEHGACSSITGVWGIPVPKGEGTLCLLTDPMTSSLIFIPISGTEEAFAMDEERSGLDLDHPTLAASITLDGIVIQVTDASIRLSHVVFQQRSFITWDDPNDRAVVAFTSGPLSLVVVAIRNGSDVRVELRSVSSDENGCKCTLIGLPLALDQEPICFDVEELGSKLYLFIGTSQGKLLVMAINSLEGLTPHLERGIMMGKDDLDSPVFESLKLISTAGEEKGLMALFCGLRSGHLIPFRITQDDTSFEIHQLPPHKLGETSVRIGGYESDKTLAVVSCGPGLWRVSHSPIEASLHYSLEKVWITDQSKPEKMQPIVDIFNCVDLPAHAPATGLSGSLLCITDNTLFACSLEKVAKAVPREIRVRGNPKRLVYSEYLNKLIVAYNRVDFDFTSLTEGTKRWIWPKIGFLDPDGETLISAPIDLRARGNESSAPTVLTRQPVGASGEKVTALVDWKFYGDGNEYHMIVVGTSFPQVEYKAGRDICVEYRGRVVYITVRQNPPGIGNIDCMTKRIHMYNQPVRTITSFGPSSLIVASGDDLLMQTLDPSTRKWRSLEPHHLESHAVSITVKEPFIYVLTARHSLIVLRATQEGLILHAQAGVDKGGLDHVNLDGELKTIFTANRGGAVIGLREFGLKDDRLVRPVFSAITPSAVVRVCRSFRPHSGGCEIAYGTTLDGTLYRFQMLTENEWRILRFIQYSCLADTNICPFRRKRRMAVDELCPLPDKPEYMHIDGDILARLISRGARYLEDMMRRTTPDNAPPAYAEKKVERFVEFARLVVGETNDPFTDILMWMENMLRVEI
ncbi:hypothetical protein H109_02592 [Trichophyton interdigitale MR816]|uniref:Uncharacterized protein n=1 Tax=Trichophyton interdigitale (strain MR816) TaxID=1215338 RepID=A0A059JCJ7_TRIIM|nr:hypothetical protein H109_02592 [Trichophyton interdigitale MR816]